MFLAYSRFIIAGLFSFFLSFCWISQGICEESSKSFIHSDEANLDALEKMHGIAEDLIAQNDFREALRTYSEILLIEPDDETAYANMGHIYMLLGDYENAQSAFFNTLHINPENKTALLGLQKIKDPDGILVAQDHEIIPEEPIEPLSLPMSAPVQAPSEINQPQEPPKTALSEPQKIQQALQNAGLYNGEVDGKIGPATHSAIRTFQAARGLEADGIVGPVTWNALEPYLSLGEEKTRV